nr:hypothetical protein MmNV_36 [Menippe mercenaria nudivirus]
MSFLLVLLFLNIATASPTGDQCGPAQVIGEDEIGEITEVPLFREEFGWTVAEYYVKTDNITTIAMEYSNLTSSEEDIYSVVIDATDDECFPKHTWYEMRIMSKYLRNQNSVLHTIHTELCYISCLTTFDAPTRVSNNELQNYKLYVRGESSWMVTTPRCKYTDLVPLWYAAGHHEVCNTLVSHPLNGTAAETVLTSPLPNSISVVASIGNCANRPYSENSNDNHPYSENANDNRPYSENVDDCCDQVELDSVLVELKYCQFLQKRFRVDFIVVAIAATLSMTINVVIATMRVNQLVKTVRESRRMGETHPTTCI